MMELKYFELLAKNKELAEAITGEPVQIKILSNIIVHQLKEVLEYSLRIEGIPAIVALGNYDNILQDAVQLQNEKVVIFWEISNILDQLPYKIDLFSDNEYEELTSKVKSEITLLLNLLQEVPFVVFNLFSAIPFTNQYLLPSKLDQMASSLNKFIRQEATANIHLVSLDKVYAQIGLEQAIDMRNYYTSKALYKPDFFKKYALHVEPAFRAILGKVKKALIFDCDNTMWSGVLGEDGVEKLKMSASEPAGVPFSAVQSLALQLHAQGVLLGLCSKNNPQDVDDILSNHPDMQVRDEHLVIKRVNWQDKISNLREIAKELNIGLDSILFIDDSDFEVNLIREQLPEVRVLQVPKKAYQYPQLFQQTVAAFFNPYLTEEDRNKSGMYKQQFARENSKNEFGTLEDYIRSLEIKIILYEDAPELIDRMVQMTQKTNQFNLTTRRYTETEMRTFVDSDAYKVVAIGVEDKYGDNGITGLAILRYEPEGVLIDSLLMSCRIIGRSIEWKFLDTLISHYSSETIYATFKASSKNQQVTDFYQQAGFTLVQEIAEEKHYKISKSEYKEHATLDYIAVVHGRASERNNGLSV
jgi:FkbH-like protein